MKTLLSAFEGGRKFFSRGKKWIAPFRHNRPGGFLDPNSIAMNNRGDTIELFDHVPTLIQSVTYEDAEEEVVAHTAVLRPGDAKERYGSFR